MTTGFQVLHVSDFAAPYPGAFIRQLRMLDEELRGRGAAPTAFAFPARAAGQSWLRELDRAGNRVFLLPDATSRAERWVANAIGELIDSTRCDVLHTHFGTYDLSATRAMRQWRRANATRAALVWHYRTALEEPLGERSAVRRLKDHLKYARAGGHVDACIAVTEATAEEVAARGMGERARAVVAGCDTDTLRPDPASRAAVRAKLGIADDELLVLHMGWHWHRKGGDLLAAAARELESRGHTKLRFASIGAPPDELEAPVIRLEPTDRVFELHQASDVFVSASRSEAFGNGLIEALACENVAIAALVAGQQETFPGEEAGCIAVPPGNAIAIADALETLLERRADWSKLGAAGRAHVLEHHSMRRWARELADTYAELRPDRLTTAAEAVDERLSA